MNILLTGTRHFVALTTARQLHKSGHTIYSADSIDFDYTGFSLAVKKRFEMPSVRFAEKKYMERLASIVQDYKIDKIIPLSEEIFYIARNIAVIVEANPKIIVEADHIEKLERLHNKETFSKIAKTLKLKIPKTIVVSKIDEVISYQEKYNEDIVLKPIYSRFADHFLHFKTAQQTKKYFAGKQFDGRFVLQDFIEGENVSSYSINKTGEVITYHSEIKMNKPGAMGNISRITTPKTIREADEKIRNFLDFEYQLALDFIKTPSGELYLLEANPRATMGRMLMKKRHAQFRILAFHQLINGLISKGSYLKYFKTLMFYPDAVSKWSDPAPVLVSQIGCVGLASYLRFRKKHPGASFQAYSTYDMEYNGDTIEYETEHAKKSDNEKILDLIEGLSTNKSFSLAQTRRPDPTKSFESDGKNVSIVTVKSQNEIAYLGVCAENNYYLSQKSQPIGYISAIRKNPDFLYQIDWKEPLFGYMREHHKNVDTFLYAIMSDNAHAIKSLTKSSASIPPAQLICKYKTFIVNARRFKTAQMSNEMSFCKVAEKDLKSLMRFLEKEGRNNDFFPVVTDLRNNFLGATKNNSYILKKDQEIVGFATILDQSHKKQNYVKEYSKWIRAIKKPFNSMSRPLKLITMPEEGSNINCPSISLCIVKDNSPEVYRIFMSQLSDRVKKRNDIFMISMPTDDPRIEILESWWNLSISYNLYAINYLNKKIRPKNIFVDAAIF